jgi:hypothetical protein
VTRKSLNFGPVICFSTMTVQAVMTQKLITEVRHSSFSPDLAPNDVWLFPEIKYALKGCRFQDIEDIKKM